MVMAIKPATIALWALSIVLAAMFLMSGAGKLFNVTNPQGMTFDEQFVHWGLPAWFRIPVGLLEVAGAIGLLVPRLRFLAASGLVLLMLGGTVTHLRIGEYNIAPFPFVLAALAGVVAWFTKPEWVKRRLGRTQPADVAPMT